MKPPTPQPLLRTPEDQQNKIEGYKARSRGLRGRVREELDDHADASLSDESEQIAKSHGIYLEYNRAKTGREKDWIYMVRIGVPGGGPLNREQWRILDELSEQYTTNPEGKPSLRPTTRQNIQMHWVRKPHLARIVRAIAETGFCTLNGCGDNTRNVMGCPLSRYSEVFDANAMAARIAAWFRLPAEPHIEVFAIDPAYLRTPEEHFSYGPRLLNRKFKIAFSAVHRDEETGAYAYDNCVELRTNDIGVAPLIENDAVAAYQVYIGGGQGEKNAKATMAALGKPFGIFTEDRLPAGLDAIVRVHQEWGDRKNRHWARLKYVVRAKGLDWYRDRVRELGCDFEPPDPGFDPGPRHLHHGWIRQPANGRLAFGAYVECGRIVNGPHGDLKTMVRHLMDHYDVGLLITPNQDLLFTDLEPDQKDAFASDLARFGHGTREGKPVSRLRLLSGACVGLYTCRLAYTESEQFEPELLDDLEKRGYGDLGESIGITGCERQCFRPATKTIGWVGQGPDLYALKLGGSEDARHQGEYLVEGGRWYLRQVPRKRVGDVTTALFEFYLSTRASAAEDLGTFHRRVGPRGIIARLAQDPSTADLMEKTWEAPFIPEDSEFRV